jgi:hypothetical protein
MVAQRRCRVREQRDKRESRERQNLEEKRPKELEESMLLGRERSIVSCAQQTRAALFFTDIVLSTTIAILCNRWCPSKVTTQKDNKALKRHKGNQLYTTTLPLFSPTAPFYRQINKYNIHVISAFSILNHGSAVL